MATLALPAWLVGATAGTTAGATAGAATNNEWYNDLAKWLGENLIEKPTEQSLNYFLKTFTGYGRLWGGNEESDLITAPLPNTEKGDFEKLDEAGRTPMASLGMTATPGFNSGNDNNEDEEKKDQIGKPITDTSDENVEEKISTYDNIDNYLKLFQQEQDKYIALQEKWRKEDQERADTAYSRAIKDMYRSGIDPNQIGNITPAEVGGTIQQPFNGITTGIQTALSKEMEVLQTMIEQSFKGDENEKDRFTDLMNRVISAVAILGSAYMKG